MLRISLDKQGTICLKSSSTTEQTANPSRDFAAMRHFSPASGTADHPARKHSPYRQTFTHAPGLLNSELKRPFESSQSLWVRHHLLPHPAHKPFHFGPPLFKIVHVVPSDLGQCLWVFKRRLAVIITARPKHKRYSADVGSVIAHCFRM